MVTLLAGTFCSSGAGAATAQPPAPGLRVKGEFNLGPAFAPQIASFDPFPPDAEPDAGTFVAPLALVWPTLGINVGHFNRKQMRWGVRLALQLGSVLAGGADIPGVEYDAVVRAALGPTVGWKVDESSPLELEFGLGLALQTTTGGQIGEAPNLIFQPQMGLDALGRVIWRPGGEESLLAFQGGLNLGWAMGLANPTNHAFLVVPEVGIVVGL